MVTIDKFDSVGDWEAIYIDGETVCQNHLGQCSVLSSLEEGMTIEKVVSTRVNLPDGERRYPSNLEDVIQDERYDFDG